MHASGEQLTIAIFALGNRTAVRKQNRHFLISYKQKHITPTLSYTEDSFALRSAIGILLTSTLTKPCSYTPTILWRSYFEDIAIMTQMTSKALYQT